jgi:hypothetical protein
MQVRCLVWRRFRPSQILLMIVCAAVGAAPFVQRAIAAPSESTLQTQIAVQSKTATLVAGCLGGADPTEELGALRAQAVD